MAAKSGLPFKMLQAPNPKDGGHVVLTGNDEISLLNVAASKSSHLRVTKISYDAGAGLLRALKSDGSETLLSGFLTDNAINSLLYNNRGDVGLSGAVGESGHDGRSSVSGPVGCVGIKGDPGSKGMVGERGRRGAVGDFGAKGESGEPGQKGRLGFVGATGATGADGEPGIMGPAGNRGIKGQIGNDGPVGITGDTGCIGDIGPDGYKGIRGYSGLQGPTGSTGAFGTNGAFGEKGLAGEDGPIKSIVAGCNMKVEWVKDACSPLALSVKLSANEECKPCDASCFPTTTTPRPSTTTPAPPLLCPLHCGDRVDIFMREGEAGVDTKTFDVGDATLVKIEYFFAPEHAATKIEAAGSVNASVDNPSGYGSLQAEVPGDGDHKAVTVSVTGSGQQVSGYYIVHCLKLVCGSTYTVHIPADRKPHVDITPFFVDYKDQLITVKFNFTKSPDRIELRSGTEVKAAKDNPTVGSIKSFIDSTQTGTINVALITSGQEVEGFYTVECKPLSCGSTNDIDIPAGSPIVDSAKFNVGKTAQLIRVEYQFDAAPDKIEVKSGSEVHTYDPNPVMGVMTTYIDSKDSGVITVDVTTSGQAVTGSYTVYCETLSCGSKYHLHTPVEGVSRATDDAVFEVSKAKQYLILSYAFSSPPDKLEMRLKDKVLASTTSTASGELKVFADNRTDYHVTVSATLGGHIVKGNYTLTCRELGCGDRVDMEFENGDSRPVDVVFKVGGRKGLFKVNYEFEGPIDIEIVESLIPPATEPTAKAVNSQVGSIEAVLGPTETDGYLTVRVTPKGSSGKGWIELECPGSGGGGDGGGKGGICGEPEDVEFDAVDEDGGVMTDCIVTYLDGTIPQGLTWVDGSTGRLTGTPTEFGDYEITLRITCGGKSYDSKVKYKIDKGGCDMPKCSVPLEVPPMTCAKVCEGIKMCVKCPKPEDEADFDVEYVDGKLPPGISFTGGKDGKCPQLEGLPTEPGDYEIYLKLKNKKTGQVQQQLVPIKVEQGSCSLPTEKPPADPGPWPRKKYDCFMRILGAGHEDCTMGVSGNCDQQGWKPFPDGSKGNIDQIWVVGGNSTGEVKLSWSAWCQIWGQPHEFPCGGDKGGGPTPGNCGVADKLSSTGAFVQGGINCWPPFTWSYGGNPSGTKFTVVEDTGSSSRNPYTGARGSYLTLTGNVKSRGKGKIEVTCTDASGRSRSLCLFWIVKCSGDIIWSGDDHPSGDIEVTPNSNCKPNPLPPPTVSGALSPTQCKNASKNGISSWTQYVGSSGARSFSVSGGQPPYTWHFGGVPSDLTETYSDQDKRSVRFIGTWTHPQSMNMSIRVTDSAGKSSETYCDIIKVVARNP